MSIRNHTKSLVNQSRVYQFSYKHFHRKGHEFEASDQSQAWTCLLENQRCGCVQQEKSITLFEGFPFCLCVKSVFLFLCYFLFYFDIPSSRALCSVLLICHKLDSVQLFSPGVSALTSSPLVYLDSLLLFSALLCPLSWLYPLCVSPKVL